MDHEWIVIVNDANGAPVSNAVVALLFEELGSVHPFAPALGPYSSASPTHGHVGDGRYLASAPIVPREGSWVLVVRVPGKSPVLQPLTMARRAADEMTTAPEPRTAATVASTSEVKIVGASKVRRTTFRVKVFASSEVVFVSGTDYSQLEAPTRFRTFAENYRDDLRRAGRLDDGVIFTLFSTQDRTRERWVPAVGGGWLRVESTPYGLGPPPAPTRDPSSKALIYYQPKPKFDISIVDAYEYMSNVGAADPRRIKDVGFFSHSWSGGPILFDTNDNSHNPWWRDPQDFDGRQKDFNEQNVVNSWPTLKEAMANGCTWHVWGCDAVAHQAHLTTEALKHKADGDETFFTVETHAMTHTGDPFVYTTEHTTRSRVRALVDRLFKQGTYMSAAAARLELPVFGAPPGTGSSYGLAPPVMFIDASQYQGTFDYYKDEFGADFVPTTGAFDRGYVDYRPLVLRTPVVRPPFSSEYYSFARRFAPYYGSGDAMFLVDDDRWLQLSGADVALQITQRSDAYVYAFIDPTDARRSQALLVQTDGRVFHLERDAAAQFTVLGKESPNTPGAPL